MKWSRKQGEAHQNERFVISKEKDKSGREMLTTDKEQVLQGDGTEIKFHNNNNNNHDNYYGSDSWTHNRFKGAIHSFHLTNAGLCQEATNLHTKPWAVSPPGGCMAYIHHCHYYYSLLFEPNNPPGSTLDCLLPVGRSCWQCWLLSERWRWNSSWEPAYSWRFLTLTCGANLFDILILQCLNELQEIEQKFLLTKPTDNVDLLIITVIKSAKSFQSVVTAR